MLVNTKSRTSNPEIMDDFNMEGDELKDALDKISKINRMLGGNKLTLDGVKQLLKNNDKSNEITIVDVGCGNGDMLRNLANNVEKINIKLKLIGIDANNFTINYATQLSSNYKNIEYRCQDIFDKSFSDLKYDIVLCTLTLHHFNKEEIVNLLKVFNDNSSIGIVINDLQRSSIAYRLFQLLCAVFRLNTMTREDGLTSILRGFKKQELIDFSEKLNLKKYKINWRWAFRYQWIISKI